MEATSATRAPCAGVRALARKRSESAGQDASKDGGTYQIPREAHYSQPMPATSPDPDPRRLSAYLRQAARARGYDIDTPRSGATKKLAANSGLPTSTISRVLNGELIPQITTFQALADTLHLSVIDLLVEAQLINPSNETGTTTPTAPVPSIRTPEDAAQALGIHPDDRPLFVQLVQRLTHTRTGGAT